MENTIFTLILRQVQDNMRNLEESLAQGGAGSFEEYCHMTGRYAAYVMIHDEIKELEKRFIAE